ncbi:MAG: hypothetical protein DMG14_14000 [Acidobacteria bacterium]|nr:MAG: hypothetical protein DMG14_14000 [Acidobacteriota bacterium]
MKKGFACFLFVAVVSIVATPLIAHHGRGATYEMKKQITLKGVVTEVSWRNPHVAIYMDVKDGDGKVVNWAFENSNVSTLARQGYNRNTLRVGQEITAVVNPSAAGTPRGLVVKVILADGKIVMSRESGANPVD